MPLQRALVFRVVQRPALEEVACLGHRGHVTDAVQWLRYLEPTPYIGEAPNRNVFNLFTGFSIKMGGWPR